MPLPPVLILLAVIALVLYIVWTFFLNPAPEGWIRMKALISALIVVLILIFWYVLPVRVGP